MTELLYRVEDSDEGLNGSDLGIETGSVDTPELPDLSIDDEIFRLIETCRSYGKVTVEELAAAANELGLSDDQVLGLYERLEEIEVEVITTNQEESLQTVSPEEVTGMSRDTLRVFLDTAGNHKILTRSEETDLAKRIEKGDLAAKDEMVRCNVRLAVSVARKFKGRGVEYPDLIQEALLGSIRATEKFDWRKGFKFSTYATWWIRQTVQRAVYDKANTIRNSVQTGERRDSIYRAQEVLWQRYKREPTIQEIAEETFLSAEIVTGIMEVLSNKSNLASLDKPVSEDGDVSYGDFIADNNPAYDPEAIVLENLRSQKLKQALQALEPNEIQVLTLRFGLNNEDPWTLKAVGLKLGVSGEKVRQLEDLALKKLQTQEELLAWRDELSSNGSNAIAEELNNTGVIYYVSRDGEIVADFNSLEERAMDLLATGKTYAQIGAAMGIKHTRAKHHIQSAYVKLGVKGISKELGETGRIAVKRRGEMVRIVPEPLEPEETE